MTNMKAVRVHDYGGVEVLRLEDAPRPQPGIGEVLVRVHASSVNPIDWKTRAGYLKAHMPLPRPFVLGRDVSGVVEATGPGVTAFRPGDEVYGLVSGAYAQYVVAKQSDLARKPRSLDHAHAAAIPLAALTAWQALFDKANLDRGQKVLIQGGAGGVGNFAVQLAKWKGAHVIATASGRNQGFLREIGVDQPIDYEKTKFEDIVSNVDAVFDTIGGDTQQRSFRVLKRGGVLVSVAAPPSSEEAVKLGVRAEFAITQPDAAQLAKIAELVDAGQLKPIVDTVMPLSEVRRAHEMSERGHVRGKILLTVD